MKRIETDAAYLKRHTLERLGSIEMHNPQGQLLEELGYPGITQESVAITYAFLIAQESKTADWPKINAAIREKWKGKTALERVKKLAWKQVENWRTSGAR